MICFGRYQHGTLFSGTVLWKDKYEFDATLKFVATGRHGDYCWLEDVATNLLYPMCNTDFVDMLQDVVIDCGIVSGRWGFVKHGSVFGIKWLAPGG